jgi:uncharacterized iron-regulated membrane protein
VSTTATSDPPADAPPPTAAITGGVATASPRAHPRSAGTRSIGPLVLRLHFYAGVLVAPFLVVAALTGLAFVFTPQLDRVVYGDQLRVDQMTGTARPLAEQVSAARAAHPDGDLATVIPPGQPTDTTKVVFSLPELGERQHTLYVNPYTNRVQGTLTTWFGETPLMTWVDDLHRNLHLGVLGRHYSELAASWLWVVVLGGLVLWLRRQWTGKRRLRRTLLPDPAAGRGVRRIRSWHAVTGVWLAVGLLALSATGLTWSRYAGASFNVLQDGLNAHSPTLDTTLPAASAADGGNTTGHHGSGPGATGPFNMSDVDVVVIAARQAGLTGPVEVTPPSDPGTGWLVVQDDRTWPVRLDQVAIDPDSGAATARSDFADWPLLAQLSKLGVAFHMGYLFGLTNQLILTALAVGLLCVITWGYRMWWQRRPTRADRRSPLGTPPARGTWRQIHPAALVAFVAVVAFVGWAVPVLGITLAAFLLVDALVAGLRRWRTRQARPASPARSAGT